METNIKRTSKKLVDKFNKDTWSGLDIEHYGRHVKWVMKPILFKVMEGSKIIAVVDAKFESGVVYINKISVLRESRRHGIGKMLILKVEKESKKMGAHKIFLITGKEWDSCAFYKKTGFKKTANLKNHFFGFDFVIYSKEI